jgi:CHAT domain-containing protein
MSATEQADERKLAGEALSLELQLDRESLSRTSNEVRRAGLRNRLRQARIEYAKFRQNLYLGHPLLKITRGELAPLKVERLRSVINDGRTALLEYVITENNVYLFVMSFEQTNKNTGGKKSRAGLVISLTAYPLGINREALSQRVTSLAESLMNRDESFHAQARELYDLLIKPAADQLANKTKLTIVPDGLLWNLPFETLQPAEDRYLLDQASTSYAPSLSALRDMNRQSRPAKLTKSSGLLAFTNPQLSKELVQRVDLVYKNQKIEPSPERELEVERLKTLFGDAQSRTFTGAGASEERVRAETVGGRVVHFAAPAILDDTSPMYSFIALSASGQHSQNDGLLQTREIMNLETQAQLVVLSAAEVRSDRTVNGEAAMALAWAWFVAGSPSTVFSRWHVKSPSTTQLMVDFYSRLRAASRNSSSKAGALQQSALALRNSTAYQHPYYWGAFSLVGDAR